MFIYNWGKYPKIIAKQYFIKNNYRKKIIKKYSIRANGKCYGDSSLYKNIIQTNYIDKIISFDKKKGIIHCESGATISYLLDVIMKWNWYISVTPGTGKVTVGGAVASDVHGKNHFKEGAFSKHVLSIKLMLSSGRKIEVNRKKYSNLFYATCGGMGLTGIILSIKLKLKKLKSNQLKVKNLKYSSFDKLIEKFEEVSKKKNYDYCVAWLDFLNKKKNVKSVLSLARYTNNNMKISNKFTFSIPKFFPGIFLNYLTIKIFNKFYFYFKKNTNFVDLKKFYFPLDRLKNWNNLYGPSGLIQYQFVMSHIKFKNNFNLITDFFYNNRIYPFLTVLKIFGPKNKCLLSFPHSGYTLAMDFKNTNRNLNLLKKFDNMILDLGGKIYLAKDAITSDKNFKSSYPNWKKFQKIRLKYNAQKKFCSNQSLRLGL